MSADFLLSPTNISCIVFINLSPVRRNEHFCHFEQIPCPDKVRKFVSSVTRLAEESCGNQTVEVQLHLTDCNRAVRSNFFGGGGGENLSGDPFIKQNEGTAANHLFCRNPFWLERNYSCRYAIHVEFSICHSFPLPLFVHQPNQAPAGSLH